MKSTPITIKPVKHPKLRGVGNVESFEAHCQSLASSAASTESSIAAILAFCMYEFYTLPKQKDVADGERHNFTAIDRARGITGLRAGLADQLGKALRAIKSAKLPEGVNPRTAALTFGAERAAEIFGFESERKRASKEASKERQLKKLAAEKKDIEKKIADAKAEGRAEAEEEAVELPAFVLIGETGEQVTLLTPQEYMELAAHLSRIRSEVEALEQEVTRAVRETARDAA